MSQFFASCGQSNGVSASTQSFQWIFSTDFFYDWLVGSPCSPKDSQESSPTPQFKSKSFSVLSLPYGPTLTSIHDSWKKKIIALTRVSLVYFYYYSFIILIYFDSLMHLTDISLALPLWQMIYSHCVSCIIRQVPYHRCHQGSPPFAQVAYISVREEPINTCVLQGEWESCRTEYRGAWQDVRAEKEREQQFENLEAISKTCCFSSVWFQNRV